MGEGLERANDHKDEKLEQLQSENIILRIENETLKKELSAMRQQMINSPIPLLQKDIGHTKNNQHETTESEDELFTVLTDMEHQSKNKNKIKQKSTKERKNTTEARKHKC